MAVTIRELIRSGDEQTGDSGRYTIGYVVEGTTDRAAVKTIVAATRPATIEGKTYANDEIRRTDNVDLWLVDCLYRPQDRTDPGVGDTSYNFEIGVRQELMRKSHEHIASYGADGFVPTDHGGLINVDAKNKEVAGVDIEVPVYAWSETHTFSTSAVTGAYRAALYAIANRPVNDSTWRGFAGGEVRFRGARGVVRASAPKTDVTFQFEATPNETGLMIGNIGPIEKKGWDYVWIVTRQSYRSSKKQLILIPTEVHVERVYKRSSFSGLGIGG